jgi:peptide/nickel transport system permease protein
MSRYLLRRLGASLVLVVLVVTITFFLLHLAPGSPVDYLLLGAVREGGLAHDRLERALGLDRPLFEQYLHWLGAAARGDLGTSFVQGRPVARVIGAALPNTLLLGLAALLVEYALALPLGVWAARRRGRAVDHGVRVISLLLYSLPVFWLGLMAILLFAYRWPVLPASHMFSAGAADLPAGARLVDLLRHLVLPATVLGLAAAGGTLRFVRGSLLEVLAQDFVRTARAKGLGEGRVVVVHALRNALAPVLQVLGVSLPTLLNGSLVLEVVFSWPGLGQVAFRALTTRDYPVILAATAVSAVLVVAGSLLADLLHAAADPRLRRA